MLHSKKNSIFAQKSIYMKTIYTKFTLLLLFIAQLSFAQDTLKFLGTYRTLQFDASASEIPAYESIKQYLYVSNSADNALDVIDIANPNLPQLVKQISLTPYGGNVNSVAVMNGIIVAAVEGAAKTDSGSVVFFDTSGTYVNQVKVGALPDMVAFTPDGNKVLSANEGEPDGVIDPNGSVSIIDISGGVSTLSQANVTTVDFSALSSQVPSTVKLAPGKTFAEDAEPEYITFSKDSKYAYVVLQESNAMLVLDIVNQIPLKILPFGFKDHSQAGNGMDASNSSSSVNITTHPVFGMYQPDAIASYQFSGQTYLVTANEGDSKDGEDERIKNLTLDASVFANASMLQNDTVLGRLNVTTYLGDTNSDNQYEKLYAFGTRSFSIWDTSGTLIYDSGDDFAQKILQQFPNQFNSNNDDNTSFKSRSDDKGCEPEGVTIGIVNGTTYAFIGLERMGGIMVYDITDPNNVSFVQYLNHRNFQVSETDTAAGDLAPEGLVFIPDSISPNGQNLLAVANEVSGTVSIYQFGDKQSALDSKLDQDNIIIYPNPIKINQTLKFSKKASGFIFNALGQVVKKFENENQVTIDFGSGVYFCEIFGLTQAKKIIVIE